MSGLPRVGSRTFEMDMPRAAVREQLELEIEAIRSRPAPPPAPVPPRDPARERAAAALREAAVVVPVPGDGRKPFGAWLVGQGDRREWWSALAKAAKADRAFPQHGDVEAVTDYLKLRGADGDAFEQLDDADSAYRAEVA